jgi:hypothetical protein
MSEVIKNLGRERSRAALQTALYKAHGKKAKKFFDRPFSSFIRVLFKLARKGKKNATI